MPLRVVVLSHRSLFAGGIASRLREHADFVEVQAVEAGQPGALDQLQAIRPHIVIMDAADAGAVEKIPMTPLLDALPGTKVIRVDPASDHIRVYSCVGRRAQGIGELIEVMRQVSAG